MALTNRFELPNYTMVPNEFLDDVMRDINSMAELKVTLAVIRHTFGFHAHGGAELSKAWLQEYTGMSDNSVDEGLRRAIKRGTVVQVQEADRKTKRPAAYRLNINVPDDLLNEIRRARPGSGMASGRVAKEGEGQNLTLSTGSKFDPVAGATGSEFDPVTGSNLDPVYGAQTPSASGFAGTGNKDRNKDIKLASIQEGPPSPSGEVLAGITQSAICFDSDIDICPAVRACENAGILFAGALRMTVESLLERGMDPEVAAALITEAHTRRDQMRGIGFERWAAGFLRNAFQDGVRTMEDLARYRERAAQQRRAGRRSWDSRKRESYLGGAEIDWDAWNRGAGV